MLRYYLIASGIVLGALLVATLFVHRGGPLKVATVRATGSPSPPRLQAGSTFEPGGVAGIAPWALSALPECFRQERVARGPFASLRAQLPSGGVRLEPGGVLRVADCTLRAGPDELGVERGSVRLEVPPPARAFVAGQELVLLRRSGANGELRVYRPAKGSWSVTPGRALAGGASEPAW
jgi:hypothetical protein